MKKFLVLLLMVLFISCDDGSSNNNNNTNNNNTNNNTSTCGNLIIEQDEDCDGTNLNQFTCEVLGFSKGQLHCNDLCQFDTSSCEGQAGCGDGIIQEDQEDCDGSNIPPLSCEDFGSNGGVLQCGNSDCLYDFSGCDNVYAWLKQITADNIFSVSLAVDSQKNIYVSGAFSQGQIHIGSTTLICPNSSQSNSERQNLFFAKYDSSGNVLWVKKADCSFHCYEVKTLTDANDNIYMVGVFQGTIDFGSSVSVEHHGYLNTAFNVFLAKYDSDGNILWARNTGGNRQYLDDASTDASGNIYITGTTEDTIEGSTTQIGDIILNNHGQDDVFVAKYDTEGNVLWAINPGGEFSDMARSINVDANGDITFIGRFDEDYLVGKYDTNGNTVFFQNLEDPLEDGTYDFYLLHFMALAIDTDGNFLIGGQYRSLSQNYNIFFSKYNSNGNLLWTKHIGSDTADNEIYDLKLDSENNIYIFGSLANGKNHIGDLSLNYNSSYEETGFPFLAKYDPEGNVLWVKRLGGIVSSSYNNYDCLEIDNDGNIYVTNPFYQEALFDSNILTSDATFAAFLVKIDHQLLP